MYRDMIAETLGGLTNKAYEDIEDIMRNDVFHSTLDWQTPEQFAEGAKRAYEIYQVLYLPRF